MCTTRPSGSFHWMQPRKTCPDCILQHSSDMLQRVYERRGQHNNDERIAKSAVWTYGKLMYAINGGGKRQIPNEIWSCSYYHIFARIYGWCGSFADIVMVNSTWTKGHIDQLWKTDAEIVYPPCDTERLNELPLSNRKTKVISVAQFR